MFIAIVGTPHSGRKSIARFLISKNFCLLKLKTSGCDSDPVTSAIKMGSPIELSSPREMLAYVTKHWQRNFVTVDLTDVGMVDAFLKRPFFMLIGVDAPLLSRFRRGSDMSLECFVEDHDRLLHGHSSSDAQTPPRSKETISSPLSTILRLARIHVINDFETVSLLHEHLDELNLLDPDRLRPSWDTYFMTLASLASMRSNCMKRRVGAILVREKRIVATGYNGTPRGLKNCNEGGCARCNGTAASNEACLCLHAEENALLEAGRDRIEGATLYCNTCPCLTCTVKIVQVGVREVVYNLSYKVDDASARLFLDAGVTLRRHAPP